MSAQRTQYWQMGGTLLATVPDLVPHESGESVVILDRTYRVYEVSAPRVEGDDFTNCTVTHAVRVGLLR